MKPYWSYGDRIKLCVHSCESYGDRVTFECYPGVRCVGVYDLRTFSHDSIRFSIRFIYDFDTVELTRALCFMYGCIYGLVQAHTVSHGLVDRLYNYTRTSHPC